MFQLNKQLDEQGLQHIANYERGLRRLSTGNEYYNLKILTDVLAPVRVMKNLFGRLGNITQLSNNSSPLVEGGDIIFPDSEVKRTFRKNVAKYLDKKDPETMLLLKQQLEVWVANHNALMNAGMMQSGYANLEAHSRNLQKLSEAGLKALEKIKAGQTFTAEEMTGIQQILKEARVPHGNAELDVVLEIESLIKQTLLPEPKMYPFL
jgi:hypothetical protein